MKHSLNIILLCFFFLFVTSCNRYKHCGPDNTVLTFGFIHPYTFSPKEDTFSVGDTVWFECKFSNPILNVVDGKSYRLENFNFHAYLGLDDLKTNPMVPTTNFILLNEDGTIDNVSGKGFIPIDFKFENDTYFFKKGIILKKQGWYVLSAISYLVSQMLREYTPSQQITECDYEQATCLFKLADSTANNNYLMQEASDPYVKGAAAAYKNQVAFYVK